MDELEIIGDPRRLREFQPEWSRFVQKLAPANPFQMPEWLLTWWSHFGSGELRTMVFRRNGEVVGVLPCFLHEWKGRRQFTLVGSGITDYLDPLFEPLCVDRILDLLRKQLGHWTDWDICDWQDLSPDSPLRTLGTTVEETPCTEIAIQQPFEEFLSTRGKDLRRNLRRYRQQAQAHGSVQFDVTEFADPKLIDALIELHRARWAEHGESGMIEANHSERFLRDVTGLLARRGSLKIFSVRFADRIAAILLALSNRSTIFSYLSAFDPRTETFGFGRELLAQALRYAHDGGYRCWNFLRGNEPYKFSWGAQMVPKCRVVILP